jgi:hypothetical protein
MKQAAAVAANLQTQVAHALALAERTPPRPAHVHRTICRGYLRGVLLPADSMESAEGVVARVDPVLGQLLAAAEEADRRLTYFCDPSSVVLDSWLTPDDPPIRELDELEARVWQAFVTRIKTIAAEL